VKSTTPLLIRRFGVLEVCAHAFDKDLPKEAFRSVCLHHGASPPGVDALTKSSFESAPPPMKDDSANELESDWFLMLGTSLGTLHSYRLRDILDAAQSAASETEKARLDAFEAELAEAIQSARLAGQRPFPRDAAKLRVYGRWKCHDFFIEVTESVTDTLMTMDMKHFLRIWNVATMQCTFQHQLDQFSCYTPYLQPAGLKPLEAAVPDIDIVTSAAKKDDEETAFSGLTACPDDVLVFSGLALGSKSGNLQLVLLENLDDMEEPEVVTSASSHTKAILQVDFVWPTNVFVSIGGDDAMKIWSHGLVLLREIVFPQPLTAVSFRHRHDQDSVNGHADILLGFSSHVESLSFDYWSHGAPPPLLGRNALRGRTEQSNSIVFECADSLGHRGLALLDAIDDIEDHTEWLHSEYPMLARESALMSRKATTVDGAESVACLAPVLVQPLRTPVPPSTWTGRRRSVSAV